MNTHKTSPPALVQHIVDDLADADPGTLAELRRLSPDEPGGPAYWRLVVRHLDAEIPAGDWRDEALRRWAVILRAVAALHDLHNPDCRFGTALAKAGISEARVTKLLRVSGETLWDAVRALTHQVASTGVELDLTGIARLVRSDGRSDEQPVRQHIANDYYGQMISTERKEH